MRQATVLAAAAIAAVLVWSGATLTGTTAYGGKLFISDSWALIGVGITLGLVALTPLRISVRADADGIRVVNLIGNFELPWSAVIAVRYQRGTPWASLELRSGDAVQLMAIQVSDGNRAVEGIRELRRLHEEAA